uniref:GTP 3',8-cyclase n=1 Tax=Magnetococcus massalia (strain MO-1) TaxID=451514 RepID=A0A1S7LI54_MAGMO|nr:Molybdenum cofactor biosynthesis protein A [Candidatus Magnetococcus massalia]
MALIDAFGRSINYLRVSVTESCNMKCGYCRIPEVETLPSNHWLSFEEMRRLLGLFAELGIYRYRLTGGEPLLRKGIVELVEGLMSLEKVEEISLSTNALLLPRFAKPLKEAGLGRVNISLDTLDAATFKSLCGDVGSPDEVVAGIRAARAAGLEPVKVNMVVMKGINDHEIAPMVAFAKEEGLLLRFIETMPVGDAGSRTMERYMPAEEILEAVKSVSGASLDMVNEVKGAGPARYFSLGKGKGEVGVISAMSQHFCETCNRMRLTATGELVLCLGKDDRVDLKSPMRAGESDEAIKQHILNAVAAKPEAHDFLEKGSSHAMTALGG